ncbi:DNA (cytosine-5-)-methyltransferase [Microbispora sp. SCL1-1]|uniref:DNA (cytosine-5-)-methyltransferase n=1 Tax=unclassified Microbispora TaxID=2614687 RepID=UPI0011596A4F|nr:MULTISPECIES: DNA (cytosine-5-)-methyltransferase [unclassified Microbispora]NJP24427.1 DNA (cytosine-5-)-methyltransferase [Microbispora sp. CL1-1]TQS14577.1 DNA (cytosine-5-)-methyltransferase [Microbispora sp. SCL1-1]
MTLRIGSICTGYGGLDMAVHQVCGGELAWVADIDPGANQILAHRYPHLPNLGDITTVDWSQVEPVDIFTGGFPCQPVSAAGQRKGVTDDRWLFDDICSALGRMVTRPRLLVFENVLGLLSANGGDAMARVIQGLAALGYVGSWRTVRASDAGAPHRRERVFIVAWLADATGDGHERGGRAWDGRPGSADGGHAVADATGDGHERGGRAWDGRPGSADGGHAVADATGDGRYEGGAEPTRLVRRPDAALSGDGVPADAGGRELQRRGEPVELGDPEGDAEGSGDQRQRDGHAAGHRGAEAASDAESLGHGDAGPTGDRWLPAAAVAGDLPGDVNWGQYEPAIRRWEQLTGRPVPRPTEPGRNGERLSPRFVEWMQGLPAGWVTDVPGLARNAQLKALGNGVVPAQAAYALRLLLARAGVSGVAA